MSLQKPQIISNLPQEAPGILAGTLSPAVMLQTDLCGMGRAAQRRQVVSFNRRNRFGEGCLSMA